MIYSNIDYAVLYIDPSAATNGDGVSPATAANSFGTLANNTLYLIRRTAETDAVTLPTATSANTDLVNVCFFGMPKETDRLRDIVPAEAITAWGADTADHACIVADTGDPMMGETTSLQLPNIRQFFMHRCYLFRDGTAGGSMIIDVTNDSSNASVSFENCKFGTLGVDLDQAAFTTAVSSQCNAYIHVKSARVFSFKDCTVNHVVGDDMYGGSTYALYVENANYIAVQNVKTYVVTESWDMGSPALYFGAGSGAMANYDNLEFYILQNGTNGYLPRLIYAANHNHCRVKNISVDIPTRVLGSGPPTNRIIYGNMLQYTGMREFSLEDVSINLPQCWRIESSGRVLSFTGYSSSSVPGGEHRIKNISIQLAEADGLDSNYDGINYDWVKSTDYAAYAALILDFSSNNYPGLEIVTAENITVNHPRGMAFYGNSIQMKTASFKGAVKLSRTMADITSIESYYPGYALWVKDGTTLRVRDLNVTKTTAESVGGVGDPIIGDYANSIIYADEANAALRDNQTTTATTGNQFGVICGNEIDSGHFIHRSVNCICDTWNVNRTGGAPACYKLWNNALDTTSDLSLGRAPFLGVQITLEVTGKHVFECFAATKNQTTPAELATRFIVQISVPNADGSKRVYFSSTDGQWLDDASEWNNDSDLTAYKLSLPFNVAVTNADIDVKIHFNWFSALGYLYLDPSFNLTAVGGIK